MCDTGELFKSGVNLYVCAINVIPATIYLLIWLMVRKNVQGFTEEHFYNFFRN